MKKCKLREPLWKTFRVSVQTAAAGILIEMYYNNGTFFWHQTATPAKGKTSSMFTAAAIIEGDVKMVEQWKQRASAGSRRKRQQKSADDDDNDDNGIDECVFGKL